MAENEKREYQWGLMFRLTFDLNGDEVSLYSLLF